jgi:hypothetical protein
VCGTVCCTGATLCTDATHSVCSTPTTPTLVIKDSYGNIIITSPSSTTTTLFDTGTYTFEGLDFPAGNLAVDLGGNTIATMVCAGPTTPCDMTVQLNSSEDGMALEVLMFQQLLSGGGIGVNASLTVNVVTEPIGG